MSSTLDKKKRVRKELLAAGVTAYGIQKSESKALYDHIGDDEHILAAIYGQFEATSAMMVATDIRLLFIDIRALHNIIEDTSYDAFGDLKIDEGMAFSRVTLRMRPREYIFRMVNRKCARNFLNVIEHKALTWEQDQTRKAMTTSKGAKKAPSFTPSSATKEQIEFLIGNHLATISTKGEDGYPYGATVYYFYDRKTPDFLYTITKSTTLTAANLKRSGKVAFTITHLDIMTTMHLTGDAELEKQSDRVNQIIGMLFKHAKHLEGSGTPPLTQLKEGTFEVYKTRIKSVGIRTYI